MAWTMRKTFGDARHDYVVQVDGETVGRIRRVERSYGHVAWFWTLGFLVPDEIGLGYGDADTLEDAEAALRAMYERVTKAGGI
jgi:hypothetical protein